MTGKLPETLAMLMARPDIGPALGVAAQTAAGLIIVLGLYALARWLRLGGDVRLRDRGHVAALADATVTGFVVRDCVLDRARIGALVRDDRGRLLLIRRHGARFIGREVTSHRGIRLDRGFLTLQTEDRGFGPLVLDLGAEAQVWAASLRRLGEAGRGA